MYANEDIKSNSKGTIYARKGDRVNIMNRDKYPMLLCQKPGCDGFYCREDQLSESDPGVAIAQSQDSKDAERALRMGLKRMCRTSMYQFRILFNRVYYGKVQKFPAGITKDSWLNTARQVWAESPAAGQEILDEVKANQ